MPFPTLQDIRDTRQLIDPYVVQTPVWEWRNPFARQVAPGEARLVLKLELFQHTGTFKARGAIRVMLEQSPEALQRGVTTVSAGNHAIAVAYGAQQLGTTAKVVMLDTANPARVRMAQAFGAEVELVHGGPAAFDRVHEIEADEGRVFVHPFDGPLTSLGTATVGLEWCEQAGPMDAVVVPIGGGGLCSGVAAAVKQLQPYCRVYGVEPAGADAMHRSFASGRPESIATVDTIADSLGAPHAGPYAFELCRHFVDELVMVDDEQIRTAMRLLFDGTKLAVEPAGAAATAALLGPLRELRGRIGLIVCGSNTDPATFAAQLHQTG